MRKVIVHDVVQGSPEWMKLRRGIPTCSNFDKIFTGGGKLSTQAEGYLCELIGELEVSEDYLTEEESYISRHMARGIEREDEARRSYEMDTGRKVERVGFLTTECGRFGGSPDGLVDDLGGLEIKCPAPKQHIAWYLKGVMPTEYKPQVHGYLWLTGRVWWDFYSYCPGLPEFRVRVGRDEYTEKLGEELERFYEGFQEALATIRNGAKR